MKEEVEVEIDVKVKVKVDMKEEVEVEIDVKVKVEVKKVEVEMKEEVEVEVEINGKVKVEVDVEMKVEVEINLEMEVEMVIEMKVEAELFAWNKFQVVGFPQPPTIVYPQNRVPISRAKSIKSSSLMDQPKRVVVCGDGVIGVCTTYFLGAKGVAVTLIEMSDVVCAASGKAGGFLAYDCWCSCSNDKFACLGHAKHFCSCPCSNKILLYRYEISDLNVLCQALDGKLSAVYKWAKEYLGLTLTSVASKRSKPHPENVSCSTFPLQDLHMKEPISQTSSNESSKGKRRKLQEILNSSKKNHNEVVSSSSKKKQNEVVPVEHSRT
ncbi:unnamed protein product [Sphenostylis stenocarpa]|uniref:Uncharacterized protein n=1 Tax=Sphenostylis stenocarpa TaxID=92480 RepID=A0AA86SPM4_9FABA|nr:unnamed protein product [Sphenostylis stenocarpa]